MLKKENKQKIVEDLKESIKNSNSVVFVNFHGLSVKDVQELRRSLRGENVNYKVARKTLVERALGENKISGDKPEFKGELAIAYGEDLLAPARGVYQFEKKLEGKVSIQGGIFKGMYKSQGEMVEIASIPPLQTLRGMFVNIINSPIQRLAISLNEIAKISAKGGSA